MTHTPEDLERLVDAVTTMNENSVIRQELSHSTINLDRLLAPFLDPEEEALERLVTSLYLDASFTSSTREWERCKRLARRVLGEMKDIGWTPPKSEHLRNA